jgi:Zn-dependent protease with chaperone function
VWEARRSSLMLAGLIAIAVANGVLLGLTLYGLAAALIGPLVGLAIGLISANYILVVSVQRERALRRGEYELWSPLQAEPQEHPLVARLRGLTKQSSLNRPPRLGCIESEEKNAFTVGRSPEEATIVLTSGLIESLTRSELDAVLAQQLAHVENDDVRAVGIADAIADSIEDLAQIKGRFLWGPGAIFRDILPFLAALVVAMIVVSILPTVGTGNVLVALFVLGVIIWVFYALWETAKMSWRGLGQLFLFTTFLGPLSLVEAVLSPPTAALISMLVSRARVHEADARAVELTRDPEALASALRHVADVEGGGASPWLGERRYSLFVAPQPAPGRWPWLARQRATHPTVESRLETIRGDG